MPNTLFPARGISRRFLAAAVAAVVAFALLVLVPGTPAHGQVVPVDPDDNCGVDVVLILDASGSMGDNGNEGINAVRAGVKAFLATLGAEAPASNVGFVRFGTSASLDVPYTNVNDPALVTYLDTTYQAYGSPAFWTNWDAALGTAASGFATIDDAILITDGNPTTYGPGTDRADNVAHWNLSTLNAAGSSGALKAKAMGTVFGVGAGAAFTNPLPPATDPNQPMGRLNSVVEDGKVTTFANIVDALPELVGEICAPSITIDKTATPDTLPEPGGDFTFDVTVTNTSEGGAAVRLTTLTDTIDGQAPVNIVDLPGVSCEYTESQAPYDPATDWISHGDSVTCSWTKTLTGLPQSEHDTAAAAGVDPGNRPTGTVTAEETITITDLPSSIAIVKTGALAEGDVGAVGDTIEYEFALENDGGDLLTSVTLDDPKLTDEYIDWTTSSDGNTPDGSLSPGETVTGYGTYTLTLDDVNAGTFDNCATVSGTPDGQEVVSAESCTTVDIPSSPRISVTKEADKSQVIAKDTVEFTITIRNTGNVTLGGLSMEDIMEYDGGETNLTQCEDLATTTLAPGQSTSIVCDVELDSTTHGEGVLNTVAAWAWPPDGPIQKATAEVPVTIVPPEAVVGGAACIAQPIPGYGFTLDQPLVHWESDGWGPTFDPANDTLTLRLWMNTQDPTTDAPAIEYQVPWSSDLLGQEPFASAPGAPPANFIVHDGGDGYLYWPGYDDSGWTGPENGLEGIVYPGDEWRPMYSQFALNPETAVISTEYPASNEDCAPGGAIAIEKLAGPLGTQPGDAAFVDVYNRASNEAAVTWQITLKNLTDYALFNVEMTDELTPACVEAFEAAVQTNDNGNFMDPQEELVFTCDDEIGVLVAKVNVVQATATDAWGGPVKPVTDDAATQSVLASAQIGDTVWADENENGVQDNGEKGIAGATVRLTLPDNSVVETTTNANGLYLFSALPAGTYKVEVILSSIPKPEDGELKLTTPGSFTVPLADGQSYLDADFGVASTLPVTGVEAGQIAIVGLVLLMAGGIAVLLTRRRDEDGPNDLAA